MSSLRPPGLGPIVGHTTHESCRLWIRAGEPDDRGATLASDRRTIGIAAVVGQNGKKIDKPPTYYFRLHREFDRTGTLTIGAPGNGPHQQAFKLLPDTEYQVRAGTLTIDDPHRDDKIIDDDVVIDRLPKDPRVWVDDLKALPEKRSEAVFRTFPKDSAVAQKLCFLLGSCRYPGLLWKVKHADRIFRPMYEQVTDKRDRNRPKMALMVGDQIYADMFNRLIPVGLADTYEEFQERYLSAFGSPYMRRLLRSVPTYMILDDHEIEDNWTRDRLKDRQKRVLFHLAINAYMSYQWSHGPRSFGRRLFYEFDCAGYPFFVLDARTQRSKEDVEDELSDNHMLGRPSPHSAGTSQLDRLLAWLEGAQKTRKNAPKFIVSPSVFVPNSVSTLGSNKKKGRSDSWPAFPETRRAILAKIVEKDIQNVVFLSGDIHCSNIAEMTFSGSAKAKQLKAFSITSSAFYWPFPFADGDPSDYVHDSRALNDSFEIDGNGHVMDYKAWNFTQEDNFCRVEIDRAKERIFVTTYDKEGEILEQESGDGKKKKLKGTLKLMRW